MKKKKYLNYSGRKLIFMLVLTLFIFIVPIIPAETTQEVTVTFAYYGPLWDINHDGLANYLDVSSMVSHYLQVGPYPHWIRDDCAGPDGVVNYLDVSMLVSHYREVWLTT